VNALLAFLLVPLVGIITLVRPAKMAILYKKVNVNLMVLSHLYVPLAILWTFLVTVPLVTAHVPLVKDLLSTIVSLVSADIVHIMVLAHLLLILLIQAAPKDTTITIRLTLVNPVTLTVESAMVLKIITVLAVILLSFFGNKTRNVSMSVLLVAISNSQTVFVESVTSTAPLVRDPSITIVSRAMTATSSKITNVFLC
jgi:hypothetical protein